MDNKLGEFTVKISTDYYNQVVKALKDAGLVLLDCETPTERYYIVAESEVVI